MKIPLRFQVTEFDCGTVSLLNAFSFLFEREDIPAELVRAIHNYTLDCYDEYGNIGQGGTSREAIQLLTHWITSYAEKKELGVRCIRYDKESVTLDKIRDCIQKKGVVFLRCYQDCEHYVILTDIDEEFAYLWDSYYLEEDYYQGDSNVSIIFDKPFSYNRIVTLNRLFEESKNDFALGPIEGREIVLINRTSLI